MSKIDALKAAWAEADRFISECHGPTGDMADTIAAFSHLRELMALVQGAIVEAEAIAEDLRSARRERDALRYELDDGLRETRATVLDAVHLLRHSVDSEAACSAARFEYTQREVAKVAAAVAEVLGEVEP